MSLILAILPFAFRVKNVKGWEKYDLFSLVMFLLSLLLAGLYKSFHFEETIGLLQRLSFGVPLAWFEIVMINLFRQTSPHHMENNAVNTTTT